MKISFPDNNIKERTYIVNTIFKEFLSVNFTIEYSKTKDYIITLDNGNTLIIKDYFFSKFPTKKKYLQLGNIPTKITLLKTDFYKEINVLFGKNKIEISKTNITLYADIFASTFFMLTRWEEYVIKTRDKYNRFPAEASLAYKFNFLDRPIVNEYVELIWNMLLHLGYKGKRKERKFKMTLTHDVDVPRLWWSSKDFIRSVGGALLKRKNIKEAFLHIKYRINRKDPLDTFNYLMSVSEKHNLKSHFFFMSGGTSNKDNFYKISNPFILKLMKNITKRGHSIGFHPSFNAYNDTDQFKKELYLLNKYSPQPIKTGREHYLRFKVPTTWQIWEDHNMQWDSTMTYHNKAGFRCGVCYEFPVFNILTQEQLKLKEKPLIVMEGSFLTYQNLSIEKMQIEIEKLIDKVKLYNGEFVFLWHNSAFKNMETQNFKNLYETLINNAVKKTL